MNSVIESARQAHEEIDLYEKALASIFQQTDRTYKARLEKEHRASDVLNRIVAKKQFLRDTYKDATGERASEIATLSAPPPPADDLEEFYSRLVNIKEFHRKNPEVDSRAVESEIAALVNGPSEEEMEEEVVIDKISSLFSGEESLGRFLDLYASHSQYINLKNVPKVPYLAYFDVLLRGAPDDRVPLKEKGSKAYLEYITSLHSYLTGFHSRTRPLADLSAGEEEAEKEFELKWMEGTVEGWEEEKDAGQVNGNEKKDEGIWCPACQKLYSKQTVFDAHLKSKKHEKAAARLTSSGPPTDASTSASPSVQSLSALRHEKLRPAALLTYQTKLLLLSPTFASLLSDTKANVERRSALTARERELEQEESLPEFAPPVGDGVDGGEAEGSDEDEDGKVYNPLKLPLGWDGKPIPYWLFKLHGLGVEYKCEICSGYPYMGRKNFERHFQESRHAFGMRALGLPNTKHFHEITKIEDAMALAEKLKHEGKQDARATETVEELEDADGNVYDRRTYEDLKRQGLLN